MIHCTYGQPTPGFPAGRDRRLCRERGNELRQRSAHCLGDNRDATWPVGVCEHCAEISCRADLVQRVETSASNENLHNDHDIFGRKTGLPDHCSSISKTDPSWSMSSYQHFSYIFRNSLIKFAFERCPERPEIEEKPLPAAAGQFAVFLCHDKVGRGLTGESAAIRPVA